MREQRRGRAIAMTPDEVDAYLRSARTCRVGTAGVGGAPHVSALWFVWDGTALWLNSLVKSQRWVNVLRSPRVSVLVDGGDDFMELHGVEIIGDADVVGDVPRTAAPDPTARRGDPHDPGRLRARRVHLAVRRAPAHRRPLRPATALAIAAVNGVPSSQAAASAASAASTAT